MTQRVPCVNQHFCGVQYHLVASAEELPCSTRGVGKTLRSRFGPLPYEGKNTLPRSNLSSSLEVPSEGA